MPHTSTIQRSMLSTCPLHALRYQLSKEVIGKCWVTGNVSSHSLLCAWCPNSLWDRRRNKCALTTKSCPAWTAYLYCLPVLSNDVNQRKTFEKAKSIQSALILLKPLGSYSLKNKSSTPYNREETSMTKRGPSP